MFQKYTTILQSKDINKMSELKTGIIHRWLKADFTMGSLSRLNRRPHLSGTNTWIHLS